MGNKISLAGDLGSGKSTVAKLLIEALGAEYYSTGAIVRAVAEKRGMTVADLNVYMETHPEIDKEIDDGLVALSADERPLVIDSRMAWHFTEGTFKVYLSTDAEVAALRIMNAGRAGESTVSLSAQVQETLRRRESEKKRYSEKYGVDITDLSNYDLVVDTTYAKPEEISACILAAFRMKNEGRRFAHAMICPERLSYIDDAVDAEQIRILSLMLEIGPAVPDVTVAEHGGEFYVRSGLTSALAYAFNMNSLIPAVLVPYEDDGKEYVKMKNSF